MPDVSPKVPTSPPASTVPFASPFASAVRQPGQFESDLVQRRRSTGTHMVQEQGDSVADMDARLESRASAMRTAVSDSTASLRDIRIDTQPSPQAPSSARATPGGSGASSRANSRGLAPLSRSSGEVWDFTHRAMRGGRISGDVRRVSVDGEIAPATRARRTLEDMMVGVPVPTVDEEHGDSEEYISVPSATTQDINDLLTIRNVRKRNHASGAASRNSAERHSGEINRPTERRSISEPAQCSTIAESTRSISTRARSVAETMNLRDLLPPQAGIDEHERGAFGTNAVNLNWAMLMPAQQDPAKVVQRNLAVYAEESDNSQSFRPLCKMIPTIIGKLGVAIGADMLTFGLSSSNRSLIIGGSVSIFSGVIAVMLGMGALCHDMLKINPRRVPYTLMFSLVGMLFISGSVVGAETDTGTRSLALRTVCAIIFGVGLTMLNTSLPLSFAYSEMVHGDTFRDYRNEVAFVMWGIGLGLATGLTVSRSAPRDKIEPATYPFGVTHACAVVGIASATFGTCLVATNLQRQTGRLLALRTRLRQLATEVREEEEQEDIEMGRRRNEQGAAAARYSLGG